MRCCRDCSILADKMRLCPIRHMLALCYGMVRNNNNIIALERKSSRRRLSKASIIIIAVHAADGSERSTPGFSLSLHLAADLRVSCSFIWKNRAIEARCRFLSTFASAVFVTARRINIYRSLVSRFITVVAGAGRRRVGLLPPASGVAGRLTYIPLVRALCVYFQLVLGTRTRTLQRRFKVILPIDQGPRLYGLSVYATGFHMVAFARA